MELLCMQGTNFIPIAIATSFDSRNLLNYEGSVISSDQLKFETFVLKSAFPTF